jgi:hypothetical protein
MESLTSSPSRLLTSSGTSLSNGADSLGSGPSLGTEEMKKKKDDPDRIISNDR